MQFKRDMILAHEPRFLVSGHRCLRLFFTAVDFFMAELELYVQVTVQIVLEQLSLHCVYLLVSVRAGASRLQIINRS